MATLLAPRTFMTLDVVLWGGLRGLWVQDLGFRQVRHIFAAMVAALARHTFGNVGRDTSEFPQFWL